MVSQLPVASYQLPGNADVRVGSCGNAGEDAGAPEQIERDLVGMLYELISVVQKQDVQIAVQNLRIARLERLGRKGR